LDVPTCRSLLALCLFGVGVFAAAKESHASSEVPKAFAESGLAASPNAPEALVAQDRMLPGCGLGALPGPARADGGPSVPAVHRPSKTRQLSLLSAVQVLEKYRSFRESLTSP